VPWPVDFGGVFDLFYKIKALHQLGVKIHLHCFTSKREEQTILNRYCQSVNYYHRNKSISISTLSLPYIVQSRRSQQLLTNLQRDNYPILLEGIHCTFNLFKNKLKGRKILVRLHNVEYNYYRQLAINESSTLKKIYYYFESVLLKRYEKKLAPKADFIAVSHEDIALYSSSFKPKHIQFLPVFIPWSDTKSILNKGSFCLYHGNLSINENEKAVIWLLDNVFRDIKIPFVVAGKNPSETLKQKVYAYQHACIIENPSEFELEDLIKKAQINVLPSFNKTGIKLKLLNALYNGRHCLVNKQGVIGTELESLCHFAENEDSFKNKIIQLYDQDFTEADVNNRKSVLNNLHDNIKNAESIMKLLY
jgi:glycosyltransferase involved in cell wall biosynthesis